MYGRIHAHKKREREGETLEQTTTVHQKTQGYIDKYLKNKTTSEKGKRTTTNYNEGNNPFIAVPPIPRLPATKHEHKHEQKYNNTPDTSP